MQKFIIFALLTPTIVFSVSFWPPGYESEQQLDLDNQLIDKLNNEQQFLSKTNIQMPGVTSFENETYFCTSYTLNNDNTNFLIGFEPILSQKSVHHILLFGCEETPSNDIIWNCGEMSKNKFFLNAPVCKKQPNILYAWAHGAPKFNIPKGVGFRVGGNTKNNFLILQVHYMHAINEPDYSGISIISTIVPQPHTAATLLLVSDGKIRPKSIETLESACNVNEQIIMHPFAFRVHTHRHGINVGGWLVKENLKTGEDQWTLLGERNPQLPQLFEIIKNQSIIIQQGDIIAARCKYKNNEKRLIEVGPTGEDEMCNFYLMYWVDGDQILSDNICYSPGAPNYYWGRDAGLNHIPK